MSYDYPDYTDLISQYEATEYNMLDDLNKSDSGDKTTFERRRNAPIDSDSDSDNDNKGDQSDDNQSQTSYEVDNAEGNGGVGEDLNATASNSDDTNSNTSYELDNTDSDDSSGEGSESTESGTGNDSEGDESEDSDSYSSESESASASESTGYGSFASASASSDGDSVVHDKKSGERIEASENVSSESEGDSGSDNTDSSSSYSEDIGGDNDNERYDSAGSFSYETDESFHTFEGADPKTFDKTTPIDSADIEKTRDESDNSKETLSSGDDNDNGAGNWKEDIQDLSLEPHEIPDHSGFNRRGMSNHSYQHPSVDSGTLSNNSSSNESGWQDSDGMTHSSDDHESFEDEPDNQRRQPITKAPEASRRNATTSDNSDDSDSDYESESDQSKNEGFEDEPWSTTDRTRSQSKHKSRGDHFDSDARNDLDDSEYSDGSGSEYSDENSDDDSKSEGKDTFNDEEFINGTNRSANTSRGRGRSGQSVSTHLSSVDLEHIVSREKLVVDRENTVNTRERKFTKWIIGISVFVFLGAIILVIVYFTAPRKKPVDTPAPITSPIAVPIAPTMEPSIPGQSPITDAVPLPQNEVIVETSFLAYVPNGKTDGVTVEQIEDDLSETFEILLPLLLAEVLEADALVTRTRNLRRKLQQSDENDIAIKDPVSIDVVEVECPVGEPASSLCVEVTTNVPIVSSNSFTQEYASQLVIAYSSAITNAIVDGTVQDINPDVQILAYNDLVNSSIVEPIEVPSAAPTLVKIPTLAPTMKKITFPPTPTISPTLKKITFPPTQSVTEVETSTSSTYTGTTTISNPDTEIGSPTSSPSDAPKVSTTPTSTDDTCEDKNDACFQSLESGECLLTKCRKWEKEGECNNNPKYMNKFCSKSCDLCGDADDSDMTETPTESPTDGPCVDENDKCGEWAMQNECNSNPEYMQVNCRDSCGLCGCEDKNDGCSDINLETSECIQTKCNLWASKGECNTNSNYMDVFCRKSCERCGEAPENSCKDANDRCTEWASEGECTTNPGYMTKKCTKACGLC